MDPAPCIFPPRSHGQALHERHSSPGQPDASADVCAAYLDPLLAWLAAVEPLSDPHLREAAAHEAIVNYLQAPEHFDPQRADLAAYLCMAARGDLSNLNRAEARHHRGRRPWEVVEDGLQGGNLSREPPPDDGVERCEEARWAKELVEAVAGRCTAGERRVLDLLLAGERRTAVFATALEITGLPPQEQEREVKRVKDRLKKRLEREDPDHA